MKQKQFSLIEMMTVIVVILIIATLLVPTLNNLRQKAKTTICAQQLKQLGVLLSTYANDNGGYLPYSYRGDPGWPIYYKNSSYRDDPSKGRLYGAFSGHLIPYMNIDLKNWNFGDSTFPGYNFTTSDIAQSAATKSNPEANNWQLIHNMYFEGGHGPLKMFVCPEILNNPYPYYLDQDHQVPNFYGIMSTWAKTFGLPTTYKANGELFGNRRYKSRSLKLEDVNKKNILLLEGGQTSVHTDNGDGHTFTAGQRGFARFFSFTNSGSFAANNLNNGKRDANGYFKTGPNRHTLYMHDDSNELWISDGGGTRSFNKIIRFNKINAPYAAASGSYLPGGTFGGTSVASSVYPGKNYEIFNVKSILGITRTLNEKKHYYREDIGAASAFGYMNILTADLSVKKAFIGWIYENGRDLGTTGD